MSAISFEFFLAVDRKARRNIIRDDTIFAFFTESITLIALFIRDAADAMSLLCLAFGVNEPLPIFFLFGSYFYPLF